MKTAVLINIPFYSYNDEIIASLKKKGYEVIYFSYKPTVTSLQKFCFKLFKFYQRKLIKKLVQSICEELKDIKVDLFLLINPTTLHLDDLNRIFENHIDSKKVLYLWDAIATYPIVKNIFSLFDKIYSFDPIDCKEYGLVYRPTFACKEILDIKENSLRIQNDVFYIASYSKKRYSQMLTMLSFCEQNGLRFKYHLYIKNKLAFLFYKLVNPRLKKIHVSTHLMTNDEKIKILLESKAIFDTPLETQSGITMRVIEGMVLSKKIITTNRHICDFDFYNPDDFLVFDNSFDINRIKSDCSYQIDPYYYSADSLIEELIK